MILFMEIAEMILFLVVLETDTIDGEAGSDTLNYSKIDNVNNIGINANLNTGKVTYKLDNRKFNLSSNNFYKYSSKY